MSNTDADRNSDRDGNANRNANCVADIDSHGNADSDADTVHIFGFSGPRRCNLSSGRRHRNCDRDDKPTGVFLAG